MTTDAIESPWFPIARPSTSTPTDRKDSVRLLRDGIRAFPAMLASIAAAKREVLLEMYWVGNDAVGKRFRDALVERAKAGVHVAVIFDSVGSFDVGLSWWRPLIAAGGRVHEFHAIWPLRATFRVDHITRRDHRKMLVVDGTEGFTGGINLARPWDSIDDGGAGWRDDVVEVRGYAAQELRSLFHNTWRRLSGEETPHDVRPLARKRTSGAWVLASQWRTLRSIHREYLRRFRTARDRIDIANSYFVPDHTLRRALFHAVRRGVRVRVLVPAASDVPLVQFATEALFATLLRHGVEVHSLAGPMLHAKTAIIDSFTTIGTYNLDERSWRKNLEVNLAIEDAAFAAHVRGWFESDVARATRIDEASWRDRAVARRGLEWASYALKELW